MPDLSPLSLTHIQYDPEDPFAKALAIASLAPFALLSVYTSYMFLARRDDILAITTLAGQLTCEGFNSILKAIIKQPRPMYGAWRGASKSAEHFIVGTGYGMPSSHSQFVGFAFGWTLVVSLYRIGNIRPIERVALVITAAVIAIIVGYSRIRLSYHTVGQVLVGESVGIAYAFVWYFITEVILRRMGVWDMLTDSAVGKHLRLRDYGRTPGVGPVDVEREEYERWRASIKAKIKTT